VAAGATAEADAASAQHRFPCPTCGSDLRFDPPSQGLACPHCGHREPLPPARGALEELDLRAVARNALPAAAMEETRVAQCPNCGAQIEFDAALHARECPFCASPIVSDTGVHRQIKPQGQLSFLLSEEEARAAMNAWLGRLWFAPNDLTRYARADRAMTGVYVPYWTYDAETESDYVGQRGTVYYETRHVPVVVNGRTQMMAQQVARVDWTPARGRVARRFDDVLVLGSKSLPKDYTDALAPWDLDALAPYDPRYLAGFRAEGYTVNVEDAYVEAAQEMNATIQDDVRADIGGDQQQITDLETRVGELTFKHVLLPVWLAAFRYGGKSYRFVVNGRTGAVEGERPYSAVKIAIAVILGLLLALAIAWLQIGGGGYYAPSYY
jgi:DNA-directed RNA polymerase subunit RPC12/RpoP